MTETPGTTLTQKATQLYTAVWPEGIHLDAVGALYDKTVDVQTALDLGPLNPAVGNGELLLSLGRLTSEVSVTKFNITPSTTIGTSIATKIPVTNPAFTLVTTQGTGAFSGTFTPNWSSPDRIKPAFKGILLQKGASKGGYGYFISNRMADLDPESGRVTLGAQMP